MAVRPVRIYGDPILRQKAAEVTEFDDALATLAEDMFETMHAYHGVGLAGPQVGVAQRILVVEVPDDTGGSARHALVNPSLDQRSGSQTDEEGCLSIPGIVEDVKRDLRVRVRAQDVHGRPVEFSAEGYLARAIQHEVDHLNGVLFIDRLSPLKRQFLKKDLDRLARGEVPEDYHPGDDGRARGSL